MSHYDEARRDLDSYIAARVPLIGIRTPEQVRAVRLLREVASSTRRVNLPFSIYTRATGLRDLRTNNSLQDDRSLVAAMDFAASQFTRRAQATTAFVDPDMLDSDSPVTRHLAELARLADDHSGSIVLITDTPLWSGLQRLGMSITLEPPNVDEMYDIVVGFLKEQQGAITIDWTAADARRAAQFLVGVPEGTAVNILATIATAGRLHREDLDRLTEVKDKHFSDLAGLERVPLGAADHLIGGLHQLRTWLDLRHKVMLSDLRETWLRPPRGVLLVGVPGCGKSLSAKAVAAQWRLPLYRLDFAAILGMYVGQSEARLREALEMADRTAPCVLWIDEIEKGLSGQYDSTGVSRRMVGQFLYWLQESRSRVFVVATSNDVRSLPPELLRKGRFDELFFVDLPDETERAEIIRLYHGRYLRTEPDEELVGRLVAASDGFAGSDIEAALRELGYTVHTEGAASLRPEFVVDTFVNTNPMSRTHPEEIAELRAWGRERAIPAGASGAAGTPAAGGRRRVIVPGDT
ncbi:ATP-binding protein [Micromonospora sp. NPDC048871]|uniref:AAA family ATPase n=1 Tax=unclassified Micromonospora TaxID=2617518 RepID=UPI002E136224|nr:AAA family ATPase [Micromonospora sp. NBC_01739]